MIFNSIDNDGLAASFIDQVSNHGHEFFFPMLGNQCFSEFDREDGLDIEL